MSLGNQSINTWENMVSAHKRSRYSFRSVRKTERNTRPGGPLQAPCLFPSVSQLWELEDRRPLSHCGAIWLSLRGRGDQLEGRALRAAEMANNVRQVRTQSMSLGHQELGPSRRRQGQEGRRLGKPKS